MLFFFITQTNILVQGLILNSSQWCGSQIFGSRLDCLIPLKIDGSSEKDLSD